MKYYRVQTNRMTLSKIISEFRRNITKGESLVAPRPLPKTIFAFYFALCAVAHGGVNEKLVRRFKNSSELSASEYEEQLSLIEFSWTVR